MKKFRMVFLLAVVLGAMAALPAYASHPPDNQTVNATVTPDFISVSVAGTPGFGTLSLAGAGEPTTPSGQVCASILNAALTVTNSGSGTQDFFIAGGDTYTSGNSGSAGSTGTGWDLLTPGTDDYAHGFTNQPGPGTPVTNCDFSGTEGEAGADTTAGIFDGPLSGSPQKMADDVPAITANTVDIYLKLRMPTDTTKGGTEQIIPILITASAGT